MVKIYLCPDKCSGRLRSDYSLLLDILLDAVPVYTAVNHQIPITFLHKTRLIFKSGPKRETEMRTTDPMPGAADEKCAYMSVSVSVWRGWRVEFVSLYSVNTFLLQSGTALLSLQQHFHPSRVFIGSKIGYWCIFISLASTRGRSFSWISSKTGWKSFAMIKCHDCRITKAMVIVLKGLLCCKWIYQSFLCIGAWRRTLEGLFKSLLLLDDYLSSLKSQPSKNYEKWKIALKLFRNDTFCTF